VSYGNVAAVLAEQGEMLKALDEYRKARDTIAGLKEKLPDKATLAEDLARYDAQIAKLEQANAAEPGMSQPDQANR
jgi:hypothetical protein